MPKFTIADSFNRKTSGYILIAPLDEPTRQKIHKLQDFIASVLPPGSLWLPKGDQLHMTFAHVITPESEYSEDREDLFAFLENNVKDSLRRTIPDKLSVKVDFRKIQAFQPAIIMTGEDDGTFKRLRSEFVSNIHLPDETRRPPTIIHTTIARFRKSLNLETVKSAIDRLNIDITINVKEIDLIHETKIYVQDYELIEKYPLNP